VPKIVDHDERRRSLIEATWRVIAREGIASATTRGIAGEAGCSSGVLAHYFADKAELMASAMLAAHAEVHARLDTELTGLASVRQYMLECLPLDERRRFLAVVEVTFWGQAVGNRRLVDLYADEVQGFRGRIRTRLAQAAELGELRADVDVDAVVHELHVLNDGLSLQAALSPRGAPGEQQTALVDAILDRIRTAP
jgi:AcrR family transcriptional regulator